MSAAAFLVGKLPAHGDFVSRGMPRSVAAAWDAWCSAGLDAAEAGFGAAFVTRQRAMPPWRFCFDPGLIDGHWHVGAILPSRDRADRAFLLVAGARAEAPPVPDALEAFTGEVAACCRNAIDAGWSADALHAALEAIAETPSNVPAAEPPQPRLWTDAGDGAPPRALTPVTLGRHLIKTMLNVEETD